MQSLKKIHAWAQMQVPLQNGNFPIFNLFGSHFVTVAMVIIESIPKCYTWAFVLIN